MKNIFKIGTLALCLVVGLSSCNDFFDAIPGEQYDLEDTFTNRSKTEQFLNNVYNYVPDDGDLDNRFVGMQAFMGRK